jgi:DNA-3-methyladenine glycosylase II
MSSASTSNKDTKQDTKQSSNTSQPSPTLFIAPSRRVLEAITKSHPYLKPAFERHDYALDINHFVKTPYAALIAAIIGQRIKFKLAREIRSQLYSLLPNERNFTLQDIEKLSSTQLSSCGITRTKRDKIREVNKRIKKMNKPLDSTSLKKMCKCYGIKTWTIQTAMLTIDPSTDYFPTGDSFLQKRIAELYELDTTPNAKQVAKLSKSWSPHRGIVAWYLWRHFDDDD